MFPRYKQQKMLWEIVSDCVELLFVLLIIFVVILGREFKPAQNIYCAIYVYFTWFGRIRLLWHTHLPLPSSCLVCENVELNNYLNEF